MNSDWQRHVLASSGYLELGLLDDAALVLEEIEPKDKTRSEVLDARVGIYMVAKKWDMAAAVASHKQFQKLAMDDEDLRPLWDWVIDLP